MASGIARGRVRTTAAAAATTTTTTVESRKMAAILQITTTTTITTILYLTTQHPGVIRNSFKHVRETKSIENKRKFKITIIKNLSKNLLL